MHNPHLLPQWPLRSWAHWAMNRVGWRKKLSDSYRMGHSIQFIITIFLCWGFPFVNIYMGQVSSWILPIERGLSTYFFLKFSSHQYSNQVLDHLPNHWPQSMNQCTVTYPAFSPKQSEQSSTLLEVLPTGRIFLCHCPWGMFQRRSVVLQLPTLRW